MPPRSLQKSRPVAAPEQNHCFPGISLPDDDVDARRSRVVPRLSEQLGRGWQAHICAVIVDVGGRQVLPLSSPPAPPDLPPLWSCPTTDWTMLTGRVLRCRRWLGVDSGKDDARYSVVHQETPEWEIWVAARLTELIEAGFQNPPLLTTELLTRLVRLGTELEGLSGFTRILGVSTTALTEWRLGAKHPVLPVYLRLARVFQVTLTDFLTGKVSAEQRQPLDLGNIPLWRTLHATRRPHFDKLKAGEQIEQALRELPPRSLRSFAMRTGYHAATLQKHFPNQCSAIQERFRETRTASTKQRHAQKVVEFRQIAHQLHEEGVHLCVNAVLKRMSRPRSLDYPIAREVLADVKREILAKRKPARKRPSMQRSHERDLLQLR